MQLVHVQAGDVNVEGFLSLPNRATALVLFANGSGSARHHPRNQALADEINEFGIGTLLFDLLTESEEKKDVETKDLRFNIPLLANRLIATLQWLNSYKAAHRLNIGILGYSTGAAAALAAAASLDNVVSAVVSKGGRPDLAGESLKHVSAPTLLIVGENDVPVLELNRLAYQELECVKSLEIIPDASHFFEEIGTYEQVSHLCRGWFLEHLKS